MTDIDIFSFVLTTFMAFGVTFECRVVVCWCESDWFPIDS